MFPLHQIEANKVRQELFEKDLGLPKSMKGEDVMLSAIDLANIDDDVDDDLTLMELARRAMMQAASNGPLVPITNNITDDDDDDDGFW